MMIRERSAAGGMCSLIHDGIPTRVHAGGIPHPLIAQGTRYDPEDMLSWSAFLPTMKDRWANGAIARQGDMYHPTMKPPDRAAVKSRSNHQSAP